MKKTQEERAWDSLNKEYLHFNRLATRETSPKVEQEYYNRMATRTLAHRDSIRLPKRKSKENYQDNGGEN
jgi:hypothetical protein